MALLKILNSDQQIPLLAYHLIGRLEGKVDLHIDAYDVSRLHAYIEYKDKVWTFYDQSSNGTLYNDTLQNRSSVVMKVGDIMQFSAEEPQKYEIVNLDPPQSFLISEDKKDVLFVDADFLGLTEDGKSRIIFPIETGDWVIEEEGETRILEEEETLPYKGKQWKFVINQVSGLTKVTDTMIKEIIFNFELSADYEHVSINITANDETIRLPTKAMNFPLFLMAKQMRQDLDKGEYSDQEVGWINCNQLVEILKKELGNPEIDVYYLNVQIYRLRKALSKTPISSYINGLIERRQGQLRFNHQNFTIKEYQV